VNQNEECAGRRKPNPGEPEQQQCAVCGVWQAGMVRPAVNR